MRPHFFLILVPGFFYAGHYIGLERVSFLN